MPDSNKEPRYNYHKPVCVKCEIDMYCKSNDTHVLDVVGIQLYKIWNGDMWACKICGVEVVTGFGQNAVFEKHHPEFLDFVEREIKEGNVVKSKHFS